MTPLNETNKTNPKEIEISELPGKEFNIIILKKFSEM